MTDQKKAANALASLASRVTSGSYSASKSTGTTENTVPSSRSSAGAAGDLAALAQRVTGGSTGTASPYSLTNPKPAPTQPNPALEPKGWMTDTINRDEWEAQNQAWDNYLKLTKAIGTGASAASAAANAGQVKTALANHLSVTQQQEKEIAKMMLDNMDVDLPGAVPFVQKGLDYQYGSDWLEKVAKESAAKKANTPEVQPSQPTQRAEQEPAQVVDPLRPGKSYYDAFPEMTAAMSRANAGWEKYLADAAAEDAAQQQEKEIADMMMSNMAIDLPGAVPFVQRGFDYQYDNSWRRPSDAWTQDEKNIFGALYDRDPEEAEKFAIDLNNEINSGITQQQRAEISKKATSGFWSGVGAFGLDILSDITGFGLGDYVDKRMERAVRGQITEKPYLSPAQITDTGLGAVSQNLNDKFGTLPDTWKVIGGKGWGDVLQLTESVIESFALGRVEKAMGAAMGLASATTKLGKIGELLTPNFTDVIFFGNSAAAAVDEAKERGATDDQALFYGTMQGINEAIGEHFSIENFWNITDPETVADYLYTLFRSSVVEGSEEGFTTVLNSIADQFIMRDKSQFNAYVSYYMNDMNMDEKQAKQAAWMQMGEDLAFDILGGAVSGAAGSIAEMGVQKAEQDHYYKKAYSPYVDDLISQAMESPEGAANRTEAERLQKRLDDGKKARGADIKKLVRANERQFAQEEQNGEPESNTEQFGNSEQQENTGDKIKNEPEATQEVPEESKQAQNDSIQDESVLNNRTQEQPEPSQQATRQAQTEEAKDGGTLKDRAQKYGDQAGAFERMFHSDQDVELFDNAFYLTYNMGKSGVSESYAMKSQAADYLTKEQREVAFEAGRTAARNETEAADYAKNNSFQTSQEDGETLLTLENGQTVKTEVIDISGKENGKLLLNVKGQQEPVRADRISYASEGDAALFHAIQEMDISTEDANKFVQLVHSRNDASGKLAFGIRQMYEVGNSGVPYRRYVEGSFARGLSDSDKRFGYDLGRKAYDGIVQAAQNERTKKASSQRAAAQASGQKIGGVQYDGLSVTKGSDGSVSIDGVTLNSRQKTGLRMAELLGKMGLNVHVYMSQKDANGKPIGANGHYSLKDGSMHFDLNAGNSGQGIMAYTIAHEFAHFMEDQAPASFQKFTDALFSELDTDVEAEIEAKARKLKELHPSTYENASRSKLLADARSEVVAECCETMLTDTDAAERIGQKLQQQDKKLFDKIVDWFKGFAEKLRKAYEGLNPDSAIARNAKKTIQQVDSLVEMWSDMAVEAAENYRNAEVVLNEAIQDMSESEIRNSARPTDSTKRSFSWGELTQLDDIRGYGVKRKNIASFIKSDGRINVADVVKIIKSQCQTVQTKSKEPTYFLFARDIGKNVEVVDKGITHGFFKGVSMRAANETDINNMAATLDIKNILDNSIEVNISKRGTNIDNPYNHILFGITAIENSNGIYEYYAVRTIVEERANQNPILSNMSILGKLHAINAKKITTPHAQVGKTVALASRSSLFSYSVSDLLRDVNSDFADSLSLDVNKHLGRTRQSDSHVGTLLFSDRDSSYVELAKDPEKNREQLQKMVDQAAKDAGYTQRMWHGTPYGGFTKFKDWSYFTPNQEYADRYQNPSASSIRGRYNPATNPQTYGLYVRADKPFDTRNRKEKQIFQKEFYRQWGNGAPLSDMGLPDWTDGSDFVEFFEENDYDYDAIYLDEGADGGYGEEVRKRGLSMMVRNSVQVKSAEPVTYDDEGNVIPLSKRFDAENEDIRYSDRENEDTRTYAELTEELNTAYRQEREIDKKYRDAQKEPNLLKAMEGYATLYYELKPLSRKVSRGEATVQEQQQYSDIKQRRDELLKEAERIQDQLGISDIAQELDAVRERVKQLRDASDIAWAREGAEKEKKAIAKSGLTSEEYFRKKAAKTFHYTTNFKEAGYLLPDGKMLNFSGGERNRRAKDHREIGAIYEATNGSAAMNRFMRDGNIRIMAESPGIDLTAGVEPTAEQYSMLRKFISTADGEFYVDFSDENGKRVGSYSYDGNARADRILNDIRYFYENGTTREQSALSMFYSDRETALSRQNERLKADVANLRELVKIQGQVTGGKVWNQKSLNTAANFLMRETGRSLDAEGKAELAAMLGDAYNVLSSESVNYDDIVEQCTRVAEWLDENGQTEDAMDEYASGILSEMKGVAIRLDETQKAEARHLFGSLQEFRSRLAGTYKVSESGVPIDDIWNGLAIDHPAYFDGEASSAGLPGLLVEAIDRLRNTKNLDEYQHMPVELMMQKVYDGFWKARRMTTVADKYKAKIDRLNQKHDAEMNRMKEQISDIKRQWDEEAAAMEKSHKYDILQVRKEMRLDAEAELDRVVGIYKDKRKASIENRHRTEYRQKIHKLADKFHKIATAPAKANTAHAPIQLVNSVARFCEIFAESEERAIEYASNALSNRETEMNLMNDLRGQTKTRLKEADAINRQRERLLKKSEALSKLRQQYDAIQNDGAFSMFHDDHVQMLLDTLDKQLSGTDIYDMDTEQLRQVYDTMQAMMHTITNANRVFSMEKEKTLIGVTRKLGQEIDQNKVSHGEIATAVRRYGMWQMSPDTFFNFLCGYTRDNEGKAIQKMFENGSERMIGVQRDFYQMFRHLTESTDKNTAKHIRQMMQNPMKEMIDWGLKDASGRPVKTTRDMMLQAYMLLNQKDSFESLVYGGFKIPNAKEYYNGSIDRAYGDAEESALLSAAIDDSYKDIVHEIRVRQEEIDDGGLDVETANRLNEEIGDLRNQAKEMIEGAKAKAIEMRDSIEKQLTASDLDAIETANKWYKYTGQLMTDVYLQMYGYKPNLVDGYVPIHRDLTTVKTDIREGEEGKAFNLENSGFTKDRVKSVAPILLTGFFQELGNQQQKISRYYGFATVQKDFNRIWNLRMPGARTTINSKVAAKFGTGKSSFGVSGEQYIQNYIQSVAGISAHDDIWSKFYGASASATLSLNPRVAVSQLASIPTASAVVGWRSMASGFAKGVRTSLSTEKKNLLANDSVWFFQRYRGAGGITELADLKSKGGMWDRVSSSAFGKHLFNWCQTMDVFATASMWAMAEDYVQRSGMKATDEGYKLAVEQCYADIIRKSQPNYTVTERSDILRDRRGGMKLLTMYKTQSNQNLNILLNSIGEYRAAAKAEKQNHTEENKAYLKSAQRNLANGITSVTLGGTLMFVLLRTLSNFAMLKLNPYKDDETGEISEDEVSGAVWKEIFSSVAGMFALGGQLYDIVSSVVTGDKYYGISDTAIESISAVATNSATLLQRIADNDKNVEWKHIDNTLKSYLTLMGIPYNNTKGFIDSAKRWYNVASKGDLNAVFDEDVSKKQYDARLCSAFLNGDKETAKNILAVLASQSEWTEDDIVTKEVSQYLADNYLRDKVLEGEISPKDAKSILKFVGHNDPDGKVEKWEYRMQVPDKIYDLASKYKSAHDKEKTMKFINSLKIDKKQKDALYYALGYVASTIGDAPWH